MKRKVWVDASVWINQYNKNQMIQWKQDKIRVEEKNKKLKEQKLKEERKKKRMRNGKNKKTIKST
ncbi:hypothetical protein AALJ34_16980 [Paraclostridium bifermentans]|uniref:Uncharacterized protein n=1 Tax=Paraclostridium bifermentans TaxID=1490 RepID=A0ABY8R807_PARBF|nr:hypothetical protein [Paraclostridium bifermentans]MBU5290005.1 hypothetical protein [Paraclostridium bifermentans]WGX77413.1 hypothetical protein QJS64_19290 [Paraclostridium bifermentans]